MKTKQQRVYRLFGTAFLFGSILTISYAVYLGTTTPEVQAQGTEVVPLGDDRYEFVGKTFHIESECGLMVLQYVLTPPYSLDKVAPFMKFSQDQCDAENPPNWAECPRWVNKDLGLCENVN